MNAEIVLLQGVEQAGGVRDLFTAVYGDGYPVDLYYQPERLWEEHRSGGIVCAVAVVEGRVAAHLALYHSAPSRRLVEIGAGLVHPDYRRLGLVGRVNDLLEKVARERRLGSFLFGEAVCNHVYSQRLMQDSGYVDSLLEIDLMPAEAYVMEASASGRVSTILAFLLLEDEGAAVHLPEVYREALEFLYQGLGLERRFLAEAVPPTAARSEVSPTFFERAGCRRLAVNEIGLDLDSHLGEGAAVTQLLLPLDRPEVSWAVDAARRRGFFLAGLAPLWLGCDTLMLQRLEARPNWEGIHLASDRARRLLELVRADFRG